MDQKIISVPEMYSFEDVRQVIAKTVGDLQSSIISQLPIISYQGKRISNVGAPVAADDVVTLKYLQSNQLPVAAPSVVVNTNISSPSGGTVWREIPTGQINGTNTAFTITNPASPIYGMWLFLNGVIQDPYFGDYTLTGGTNIEYQVAPKVGDHHWILYIINGITKRPSGFKFDIFNTGQNDDYSNRPMGSQEVHWALTTSVDTTYIGPSPYVQAALWAGVPAYTPNLVDALWIGPQVNASSQSVATGTYTYRQFFDLTGLNPATTTLGLTVATDDGSVFYLNGTAVGTVIDDGAGGSYKQTHALTFTTSFKAGINKLEVAVHNDSGPSGMLVEFTTATA